MWYEFHHSLTTGRPYHQGVHVDIYPTPVYPDTEGETDNLTNQQIRNTPVLIDISGPESPHCTRSNEQGAPSRFLPVNDTCNSDTMSAQTMVAMETISRTIVPGGDNEPPPVPTSIRTPSTLSHQQKKICLHMYLLCLTSTCNDWQGLYKENFCNVCKLGQGLTVDLQPTYFMTYVPYRKCNLSISKKNLLALHMYLLHLPLTYLMTYLPYSKV